ncbi:MAG: hypothetical protein WAM73_19515 [Desulfobacterales bacterium]
MKKIIMGIAAALLLGIVLPAMGGVLTPEAAQWSHNRSAAAEWVEATIGPEKPGVSPGNRDIDDDTKILGQFIVDVSAYLPNIRVMVMPLKYEGTSMNNLRLDFGAKGHEDGAVPDSPASLSNLNVALYYAVPFVNALSRDRITLDVGVKLRAIDVEADLKREAVERVSESAAVPLPMIFASVKFHPLAAVSLEAEGRGISMGGNRSYGLTGLLRWGAFGPVYAAGGYRFSKYDIEHAGLAIDAVVNGPFLEAGLSF